jgi:hypothetical protein
MTKKHMLPLPMVRLSTLLLCCGWFRPGMVWSSTCCGLGRSGYTWVAVVGFVVQVLQIPLRGRFICPFEVAELAKRYFCTECASRCGAPLRNPALIALMRDEMGVLHKLWCANLTLLVLLVHA